MATLMVIGGSGFFGKSILHSYRQGFLKKWNINKIIIISRAASDLRHDNPELIEGTVELLDVDISTCKVLPFSDYVIHAAASSDVSFQCVPPGAAPSDIEAAIYNYCSLAPLFHKKSRILYVSSGAVYGQQPFELEKIPESFSHISFLELSKSKRRYALAKINGEYAIRTLGTTGMNVCIARCFAFVGRYLPLDKNFAVGNFILNGMRGETVAVKADKKVFRSYMHADDLVYWLMSILLRANTSCPTYNVGSDEVVCIDDLAIRVGKLFKVGVEIQSQERIEIDRYIPSIDLAKKHLGVSITLDLDAALQKTFEQLHS